MSIARGDSNKHMVRFWYNEHKLAFTHCIICTRSLEQLNNTNVTTTKPTPPWRGQLSQDDSHCRGEKRRGEGRAVGIDANKHPGHRETQAKIRKHAERTSQDHNTYTNHPPTNPLQPTASPLYEVILGLGPGINGVHVIFSNPRLSRYTYRLDSCHHT